MLINTVSQAPRIVHIVKLVNNTYEVNECEKVWIVMALRGQKCGSTSPGRHGGGFPVTSLSVLEKLPFYYQEYKEIKSGNSNIASQSLDR